MSQQLEEISNDLAVIQEKVCEAIGSVQDPKIKQMLQAVESKVTGAVIALGTIEAHVQKKEKPHERR